MQPYQDQECTQAIGERYFGDRSRWPKHRILVAGDTVVFHFHAESDDVGWGYRCTVIGHMIDNEEEAIPWSVHLEKTLCSLGGQFAGLLITGYPLTEQEEIKGALLDSDLLYGGIEEYLVPSLLEAQISEDKLVQLSWQGKKEAAKNREFHPCEILCSSTEISIT